MTLVANDTPRLLLVADFDAAERLKQTLVQGRVEATVDCARTLEELGTALAVPADLVVVASRPGLGWSEVAERLGGSVPFVVYEDALDEGALQASMAAGAADYVWAETAFRLAPAVARELRLAAELRRRAAVEADLRQKKFLLEQVIDSIPFVLFVKDAKDLRLQVVNRTFADAFSTTKEWLLGKLDHDYFPQEQADSFVEIDRSVLESKQMRSFEEVARTGVEGEDRIYSTKKVPVLDENGEAGWLLGITEDVTERKRAEAQLKAQHEMLEEANRQLEESLREIEKNQAISARSLASYQQRALQMEIIRQQNEDLDRLASDLSGAKRVAEEKSHELEKAAKLRSEFLANFSHEIRTPLNGIIGYADLLTREEGQRLTPHGRRDLGVIKANARTLLALINDILDLSKIESGHAEVIYEEVELESLADECTATVREYLKGKPVELQANLAPGLRHFRSDPLKLRQILLNLLSNAAKFTESGEIVLDARQEGDHLVFRVEDTGVGIPADQLEHVFEKFRQVDGSSTRKVGGTGLGLAIVRELTRLLGGTIEVQSVLGRGSTFTVRLPGAPEGAAEKPKPQFFQPHAAVVRPRVLVVDDDPLIHQLLRTDLEAEGFEVLLALDGLEALQLARQQRPAAVILDIHLPKLDGWGVLGELKSNPDLAGIPVILLSVEEQRSRGFALGACEYLVKPVEPQRLVSVVGRLTGHAGEVLVVDDDPTARALACRSLQNAGFTVVEAQNGDDALLRLRHAPPSLVVLDLVMPGRDGFEVLRQARAEGLQVPVVVLTGKTLTDAEQQILRDGMARVVSKGGQGIDEVVAEARRQVVSRHRAQTQRLSRILYVEDSPQNRDVVRRYLQGLYEVLEAEDGEHGLERARREQPELILMDLSLPRLDGWEATRRLKASDELRHIPVIALTAHASREDQAKARAAGCDDFLTKPVERELLLTVLRRHLGGRDDV